MYSDGTFKAQAPSRSGKLHKALLYMTSLLTLALLIMIIYLGVENRHRRDEIRQLQNMLRGTAQSGTVQSLSQLDPRQDYIVMYVLECIRDHSIQGLPARLKEAVGLRTLLRCLL